MHLKSGFPITGKFTNRAYGGHGGPTMRVQRGPKKPLEWCIELIQANEHCTPPPEDHVPITD